MSFVTDIELCFVTFFILFQSESTEGIEKGQTTAMTTSKNGSQAVDYEEVASAKHAEEEPFVIEKVSDK